MDVRIARIHYPITVLGPGRRVGVWFQGCTIGCQGCMSRDTWDPDAGHSMDVDDVCEIVMAARSDEGLDGVTISGGEPFQQSDALHSLCTELRRRWPDVDILAYSGYRLSRLRRMYPDILQLLDAIVAEPFVVGRPTEARWQGSSNQELIALSGQGKVNYAPASDLPGSRLQVTVDEAGVWVAGIPRRGDLDRMRGALLDRGLELQDVSWAT
jgi:anaerobic ribonucleoside-triphosphate reductase activating protein